MPDIVKSISLLQEEKKSQDQNQLSSQEFFLGQTSKLAANNASISDPSDAFHNQSASCSLSNPLASVPRAEVPEASLLRPASSFDYKRSLPHPLNRKNSSMAKIDAKSETQWTIETQGSGNGGLKNAVRRSLAENIVKDVRWVGLADSAGVGLTSLPASTLREIDLQLRKQQCAPVFVKEAILYGHYSQYCKRVLWPTLHYELPDESRSQEYPDSSWEHYKALNQLIANKIVECYKPGDTIWVNDYHILLVPNLVREKLPNAKIGFFLHVAFPSSEVFRCLPARKELLEGILGADCIGFQTPEHARHFLQTCNRILAVDTTPVSVRMKQKTISVVVEPIGIDPSNLQTACQDKQVLKWRDMIRERWPKSKLIVARDKLDSVRGLKQKILAYEHLLKSHPEMINDTVLIQVCQMNQTDPQLERDVTAIVDRINSLQSSFASTEPCVFLHKDIEFVQYVALLAEASSFAVTSIREGMNLTCHEFIYCNETNSPLVLSEFTGAAAVLGNDTILVNPWDRNEMAEAFYLSLTMDETEKKRRWESLHNLVTSNTCSKWVEDFLHDVDVAWVERQRRQLEVVPLLDTLRLREDYKRSASNYRMFFLDFESSVLGIELGSMSSRSTFNRRDSTSSILNTDDKSPTSSRPSSSPANHTNNQLNHTHTFSWSDAQQSVYKTLPEKHNNHTTYLSPQRKLLLLAELTSDPKNIVYVASHDSKASLERMFKQIPNIGLIAENGASIRFYSSEEWIPQMDTRETKQWQRTLGVELSNTLERFPGAEVEVTGAKMIIRINRCADQDRMALLMGELISHINDSYDSFGLHAVLGNGQVVISSNKNNKLSAIKRAFHSDLHRLYFQSLLSDQERPSSIEMMFIAAESGKPDNDETFEWANSLLSGIEDEEIFEPITGTTSSASTTPNRILSRSQSRTHSRAQSRAQSGNVTPSLGYEGFHSGTRLDEVGPGGSSSDLLNRGIEERVDMFSTSKHTFIVPVVYTVSVGGTGTYAQSMVDGMNGLLTSLQEAIRPFGAS